jgi:hypothetical protein
MLVALGWITVAYVALSIVDELLNRVLLLARARRRRIRRGE